MRTQGLLHTEPASTSGRSTGVGNGRTLTSKWTRKAARMDAFNQTASMHTAHRNGPAPAPALSPGLHVTMHLPAMWPMQQRQRMRHTCSAAGDNNGTGSGKGQQPPKPSEGTGNSSSSPDQLHRFRQFMTNMGMAGFAGVGMGIAADVASGKSKAPQKQGTGAPAAASNGRPAGSSSGPGKGSKERGTGASPSPAEGAGIRRTTQGNRGAAEPARKMAAAAAAADSTAAAAASAAAPPQKLTAAEVNEWGAPWTEDWDPEENLDEDVMEALAQEAEADLRQRKGQSTPRDKWITPLLDLRAVTGAVDPDQERTEDTLQGEALANKDESQTAIRYAAQLLLLPLVTGFAVSRALADPVLSFTLQNNAEAFAMTDRQKVEGAQKVHIEEARVRFDMAIGKLPPLNEEQILEHLREFAEEVEEEEREHNEHNLITVVSDSVSSIMLFAMLVQQSRGRQALFNTISRLFDGLSDIAKAVMIILIADTMLGYHSEEGWTGLIELVLGHYGFEAEEEGVVIFVGVVPVVIDVFFKYWIFIGLNKISPGAVVTIKQIDTH